MMPPATVDDVQRLAIAWKGRGTLKQRIIERLAKSFDRFVTMEMVIAALYSDRPDGGPVAANRGIAVFVCEMRKQLVPFNLHIESHQYDGYKLTWAKQSRILQ